MSPTESGMTAAKSPDAATAAGCLSPHGRPQADMACSAALSWILRGLNAPCTSTLWSQCCICQRCCHGMMLQVGKGQLVQQHLVNASWNTSREQRLPVRCFQAKNVDCPMPAYSAQQGRLNIWPTKSQRMDDSRVRAPPEGKCLHCLQAQIGLSTRIPRTKPGQRIVSANHLTAS